MLLSSWLRNWKGSLGLWLPQRQTRRQRSRAHPPTRTQLRLEVLEDRLAPASFATLHNFTGGNDGSVPQAGVTVDNNGNLYGATKFGGVGGGVLFEYSANGTFTTLHNFTSASGDGPQGTPILDSNGNLFGTTAGGGTGGQGTVYEYSANGTFTTLHNFIGSDGADPEPSLIMDSKGNLFGTTFGGGGPNSSGTVFELSPNGNGGYNFTTLHGFNPQSGDGFNIISGLVMDSAGNLYGTTDQGGTNGWGVVYKLSPNGSGGYNYSLLYQFTGGSDGGTPVGGLILDGNGNLYGTTFERGAGSSGTVFRLSSNGASFTTLHAFFGSDGAGPEDALLMDSQGNLYGTTTLGTVFELSPNGSGGYNLTTLHTFTGSDGSEPFAGLTADSHGNLYGTTEGGGSNGLGTIFELPGVVKVAPVVTPNTANLPANAASLTIKGDGFDSNAANDSVTFDNGVTGTVTSATATSLTVSLSGLSNLTAGTALNASVTVNGLSSGSPVQVATIAPVVTTSTVQAGQSASIGFWHGKKGQALIDNFNGGDSSTALADWLATTFPNLYGANAGANNLTGKTNDQVADFYESLFHESGISLDAQVLATALNVYATTQSLGGTVAAAYGFTVNSSGLGAEWQNIGSNGAAFGVANNTALNVYQILLAANQQAKNGVLYNGDSALDSEAQVVFSSINVEGGI